MPRLGVFGGSFDPVHRAHERLVELARTQLELDEVLLIPAFRSPLKPQTLASAADRLQMLHIAFGGFERVCIDERELRRGAATPSVRSLEELHAERPGARIHLLMGQDSFESLESWIEPERLAQLCELVVLARPGGSAARPDRWRGTRVDWLSGPPMDLNSTTIRAALARGERPEGLRDEVFAYIRRASLYGFGTHA